MNNAKVTTSITKEQLAKTKIDRGFGVIDLEKYLEKIKKNIKVFEEAIGKEKTEMKRVRDMIKVLKDDIRNAKNLEKFAK